MTIKMEPRGTSMSNGSGVKSTTRRRYVGNNQVIAFSEVTTNIDIIGNHNTLTVDANSAIIKVIGNVCKVQVNNGSGKVDIIGNNNTVFIGDGIDAAKCVSCVGNNTRVLRFPREQRSETSRQTADAISEIGSHTNQSTKDKTSFRATVQKVSHLNGFIQRCDKNVPATFVHTQGHVYIDNCVCVRTNAAITRQF